MRKQPKPAYIVAILLIVISLAYLFLNRSETPKTKTYEITVAPGSTFEEMLQALQKNRYLRHTLLYKDPGSVMSSLGNANQDPEGEFYPGAYRLRPGVTDSELLRVAYEKMQDELDNVWDNRAPNLPYRNSYELLIVASIIEEETTVDEERPLVASVIVNRLNTHMPLAMESALRYGLQKFEAPLTAKDFRAGIPYNVYLKEGLPPTAISLPSASSLRAAAHPAYTQYLYFVATGNGTHKFFKTAKEYKAAMRKYQK